MSKENRNNAMSAAQGSVSQYRLGEACEAAFVKYRVSLGDEANRALSMDEKKYDAVSRAFFGARSQAELDGLMSRSVDDLAAIGNGGARP